MKNLISKNPVQRFKFGRKIVKAQGGLKTSTPVQETIGRYVREKNRSLFGSGWRWYDTQAPAGKSHVALDRRIKQDGWILNPDGTKSKIVTGIANKTTTQEDWDEYFIKNAKHHRELEDAEYARLQKNNNQKDASKKSQSSTTNKRPNQSSTNSVKAVPKNQINVTTPSRVQKRVNTVTSPRFKNMEIQKGWTRNYGNELWNKITDEQKNILKSTGQFTDDSFKDAKSLQTALNNYLRGKNGSLNTDNTLSQIAVDNKWGNQSQRAFDEALSAAQYQQYSPSFTVTSNYIPYYPNAQMLVAPKISLSTPTYDRSGIRNVLREFNLRPYSYSGAQRKALRMMANNTGNDNDKLLVRQMNLPQTLLERLKISFKKGGLIKV